MSSVQPSKTGLPGKSKNVLHHLKYEHLVAGLSGGVMSTLVLHPFDLIKVRFQVSDGLANRPVYGGMTHAFKAIWHQGGIKGLYQGVTPNVYGAGTAWGLYFLAFNFLKAWLQEIKGVTSLPASYHLMSGMIAGSGTLALTNPLWVIKTRMCLQYSHPVNGAQPTVYYKSVTDALIKLYKQEGIRGYYKGFVPGLFGVSHGAVQFMAYEELKKWYCLYRKIAITEKLGPAEYIMMAALSKIFAVVSTYPYQVVRSRLQDQHSAGQYKGAIDVIQKTWRSEGMRGFYKGLTPNIIRVTPACCITFLVYENIVHYLFSRKEQRSENS